MQIFAARVADSTTKSRRFKRKDFSDRKRCCLEASAQSLLHRGWTHSVAKTAVFPKPAYTQHTLIPKRPRSPDKLHSQGSCLNEADTYLPVATVGLLSLCPTEFVVLQNTYLLLALEV